MNERDLFLAALDIENVEQRAHFLAEQCGADQDRLKRLQLLLLAKSVAGSFLEPTPVAALPANAAATIEAASAIPTSDHPRKDELAGSIIAGKYTLVEPI